MRNRIFTRSLLGLGIVGLVAVTFLQRQNFMNPAMAQPQEVKKVSRWEYCYVSSPFIYGTATNWKAHVSYGREMQLVDSDPSGVAALNKLGAEGWELVTASDEGVHVVTPGLPPSTKFILKRAR